MKNLKHLGLFLILFISSFTIAQDATCDDFTDISSYPEAYIEAVALVGYSQDDTYEITCTVGHVWRNYFAENGISIGEGTVVFEMSGANQEARFKIYHNEIGAEFSFSANGGTATNIEATFPVTVDGITIDLEDLPDDPDDEITSTLGYLTFTGAISEIEFDAVECGILELCVEAIFEDGDCDDFLDTTEWYTATSFFSGDLLGYTQGGAYEVNCTEGHGLINTYAEIGITMGDGNVAFDFSGDNQEARFTIYYNDIVDEFGFSVNGGTYNFLDVTFPFVTDGITVDFESLPDDPDDDIDSYMGYLTFTGVISEIEFDAVECGITELCVGPPDYEGGCDDLTDLTDWPETSYFGVEIVEDDTIGYTQGGTQTVTFGPPLGLATCNINSILGGIISYSVPINFAFDGTDQFARFHIGESSIGPGSGRSFSVNGSSYTSLGETFPMVVDGIIIDLDTASAPDLVLGYFDAYLTFSGNLNEVSILTEEYHESNIVELCVEPLFEEDECDNFLDTDLWYEEEGFVEGDILGYSQDDTYAITCTDGGGFLNTFSGAGIAIGDGTVEFDFSGANQEARFTIYYTDFIEDFGFSVNGGSSNLLDVTFPFVTDGVTVDFLSLPDDPDDDISEDMAYLSFIGEISTIAFTSVEGGITELCVEPIFEEGDCDDFTMAPWPVDYITFYPGEIPGYTQGGTQAITVEAGGVARFGGGFYPGLEVAGPVNFSFDGSYLDARFNIFGHPDQYFVTGFSVNGSAVHYMDETFPMTVDGITIDMDTSATDADPIWNNDYLIFTGHIDEITIHGSETGISELCVSPSDSSDVGITTNLESTFTVYPNPATNHIQIGYSEIIKTVAIYDLSGQLILIENVGSKNTTLNITDLVKGMYLVQVTLQSGDQIMKKLIKE
ncbi:MAG: T9SS type A sorting domain-containing protein [Crocinitomix sp.]|nr:T9SS type A sorting domain-containing protein [Crocinitomix sp.]